MMLKRRGLSLNQSKNEVDYSSFGGTRVDKSSPKEEKVDYSQFGGKPIESEKEKAGKFKSALLGIYEGALAVPGIVQYGVNEFSKGIEKGVGNESPELSFEQENPILSHLSKLPESKGQAARRIRVGTSVLPLAAIGGIPGIIAGLVGSQAGQTIREVYGKEGKFDEFGLGEGAALATDIITGAASGIGVSLARKGAQSAARKTPSIFTNPRTGLQRTITKNAVQSERADLQKVIDDFSQSQLRGFEEETSKVSPNRFTDMTQSNASQAKMHAAEMFTNTQLNTISPISATSEQGGRAIQDAANVVFRDEVQAGERAAYTSARESAEGLTGEAPRTIQQAKSLRSELTKNQPTPEQKPIISFLDGLISDLETTTPASTTSASKLVDQAGKPLISAIENQATTQSTTKKANDLVDLVQRSNQAVNYGSELRQQSHRLSPIISTLRQEVGSILSKKPEASQLYQEANLLHARNSQVWGTKYMRNVRFSENPEQIVGASKKASNMRNLKQGIQDPTIQSLAERMVIQDMTKGGSAQSNRTAINNLSPELSPNARSAAEQLIDVKDPLTNAGGRAAIRNDILKDAAQSVNTGKRPEKILDLMQTSKGHQIVKESLNSSPQARELFKTFEKLFLEDVVSSITDTSGMIDFKKAAQILKNPEMKKVLEQIGGESLVRKFQQLEYFAKNFERNISLYTKPETQSLFKSLLSKTAGASIVTAILHSLHIPWPVITGLGLAAGAAKAGKMTYDVLQKKILSNPRAVHYLEQVSKAKTTSELAKQLPRLLAEIEKPSE